MSRWEVKKRRYLLPSPVPPPWVVYDRDNWNVGEFPTHAEALAYADRMARTVEVVLPRGERFEILSRYLDKEKAPLTVQRREWLPGLAENVEISYTAQGAPDALYLADDEVKPLALALLALHYQNEGVAGREQVAH